MTARRFGFVVNVVPEKREEYLELHRNVWPEVEAAMSANGMRNYSIFIIDDTLFGYWEYAGGDFDADMARIAEDPVSQRWWQLTDPCQTPFGTDRPTPTNRDEIWREMELAWHLD